jgi:hypothetical protein
MASELNFLPEELKPKGYAIKLSKQLRRVALVCLSIFFISAVLIFASNLLFSFENKKNNEEKDKLTSQINALNSTEQSLVLAQDRLEKIAAIREAASTNNEVEIADTVLGKDLQGISIDSFVLDENSAVVGFSTGSSQNLTRFFYQLLNSDFKNIKVTSFSYDDEKGYEVELSISS